MRCVHDGCTASLPAQLVLKADGGFRVVPAVGAEKWYSGVAPDGVVLCRCPAHPQLIQGATSMPTLVAP